MAYSSKPARSASKSNRGLGVAVSAVLSLSVVAGCVWGLASTLGTIHEAARTLSDAKLSLAAPLERVATAQQPRNDRRGRVAKFLRFVDADEASVHSGKLTAALIRSAHQRSTEAKLAMAEERKKIARSKLLAAIELAKGSAELQARIETRASMVTAYAEPVSTRDIPPFSYVMTEPEPQPDEEELALPEQIPLPMARPLIETVSLDPQATDDKPALDQSNDGKPVATRKNGKDKAKDSEIEKPSLFGSLFKSTARDGAWPGKGTKVAIYDVSNATVYMPDGTKLRAHSGIGPMRDNPRYEHVKMRGPTPAGIYRLSMREKRFYGVEAIRMTSIDGRDPKNRTGLLTHTNLLRGQKGSHGCVAFQNYQPFLQAFKRGKINMLVVVPELPSSKTQLAALYRKAGA